MIINDNYIIDEISESDSVSIHKLMTSNAKRFQRYFPKTLEQNLTIDSAKEFATKKVNEFKNKKEFLFTIKEKDKSVIGLVYIKELDWEKKQGEFAYCISSGCERKGIVTESVRKLSKYAFAELGLEILQIIVHKDNTGSVRVGKNSNFTWQRTLKNEYTPPNESPLDMELYELYKNKENRLKANNE